MDIREFLVWLSVGGGGALATSWIFERVKWFQALKPETKPWAYFGGCSVLSLLAYVINTYVPAPTLEALAPFFMIVSANFAFVFLGTAFHKISKPTGKG